MDRGRRDDGISTDAGWSSLVARRAHNPKVAGSNPAPATKETAGQGRSPGTGPLRDRADFQLESSADSSFVSGLHSCSDAGSLYWAGPGARTAARRGAAAGGGRGGLVLLAANRASASRASPTGARPASPPTSAGRVGSLLGAGSRARLLAVDRGAARRDCATVCGRRGQACQLLPELRRPAVESPRSTQSRHASVCSKRSCSSCA